jgi:hypothetical protein
VCVCVCVRVYSETLAAERARAAGAEPWDYIGEASADARLLYSGLEAELEGYVLRIPGDGKIVAKIRIQDMGMLQ